jgi:hypothetical protein
MNIHDENLDKYPKCKQVVKTWHGDCHEFSGYKIFPTHGEYVDGKGNQIKSTSLADFARTSDAIDAIPFEPQTYLPEIWQVEKDVICSAIDSLKLGLEYAEECLIDHDQSLGRTRPRNKREAEYIEEHITQIKKSINDLNKQKL